MHQPNFHSGDLRLFSAHTGHVGLKHKIRIIITLLINSSLIWENHSHRINLCAKKQSTLLFKLTNTCNPTDKITILNLSNLKEIDFVVL